MRLKRENDGENKNKSWIFEVNNIDKPLERLTKKKDKP